MKMEKTKFETMIDKNRNRLQGMNERHEKAMISKERNDYALLESRHRNLINKYAHENSKRVNKGLNELNMYEIYYNQVEDNAPHVILLITFNII